MKKNVTVRSRRRRPREYLTEAEIDKLIDAAKDNRQGHRDRTAILMAYRHGLRASELVELRWDDVDSNKNIMGKFVVNGVLRSVGWLATGVMAASNCNDRHRSSVSSSNDQVAATEPATTLMNSRRC
jgi:site-specific recombinase XerD